MELRPTVVIPMYNASGTILKTLDALDRQTFKDFEVVVVDDGSKDGSYDLVKGYTSGFVLRLLHQDNSGPAKARNLGAMDSSGGIVVFTDADCVPKEDWLSEMLKPFKEPGIVGVQGTYETLNKNRLVARYVGYEIAYRHEAMTSRDYVDFIGTFSAAYRRDVFTEFGGFDTSFRDANAEDPELSYRLKEKGYNLVFNPKAIVMHPHPGTLYRYLQQQFWRGYWRVPMFGKHKRKIAGDSYSGGELFLQGLLSVAFFFSFLTLSPLIVAAAAGFLVASNVPFGIFCGTREGKFLFLAPLIAALRSVTGSLGVIYGFFRFNLKFRAK